MPASHSWAQIESFNLAVLVPSKPNLSLSVFSPPFTSSNTSVALPHTELRKYEMMKSQSLLIYTDEQRKSQKNWLNGERLTWCVWRSWNPLSQQQTLQSVWEMGAGCERRPVPGQPMEKHRLQPHMLLILLQMEDILLVAYLKFLLWTGGGRSPHFCRRGGDLAN